MATRRCCFSLVVFFLFMSLASSSFAQDEASTPQPKDDLQYFINIHSWMTSLSGSAKVAGETNHFSAGFADDVLPSVNLSLMFHAEALYKNRYGLAVDFMYTEMYSEELRTYSKLKTDQRFMLVDITPYYRLASFSTGDSEDEYINWDIMAGVRIWHLGMDLKIRGPIMRDISTDNTWVDPLIASRIMFSLNEDWLISLRGGIGGFGVSSHLTWDAVGFIGYRLTDWLMVDFGYKAVGFDYTMPGSPSMRLNLILHGPFIGLGVSF